MKPGLGKKELVAMIMESPLYFELRVRERLELLRDLSRRFSSRPPLAGLGRLIQSAPGDPAAGAATGPWPGGADGRLQHRLIVGHFPPEKPVGA